MSEEAKYYLKDHQPEGPYTVAEVARMWNDYKIGREELYSFKGAQDWKPVRGLAEEYFTGKPAAGRTAPEVSYGGGWAAAAFICFMLGVVGIIVGIIGEKPAVASGLGQLILLAALLAILDRLMVIADRLKK
jgi:hypothetical protein